MEIKRERDGEHNGLVPVDISEWNEKTRAFIKPLSPAERIRFENSFYVFTDDSRPLTKRIESAAAICVMVLVDEDGKPLLDGNKIDDIVHGSIRVTKRILRILVNRDGFEWKFKNGRKLTFFLDEQGEQEEKGE